MLETNEQNKRQEIKFVFSLRNFFTLRIEKKLKKIYPTRIVNSIYFDTNNFDFFQKSEEGLSPRKKIRVRYYNEFNNNLLLETKITNNYYRSKFVKKISARDFNHKSISKQCNDYSIMPKLKISYQRDYYQSEIGRITVDNYIMCKQISTYVNSLSNINKAYKKILDSNQVIVELKTINNFSKYEAIKFFEKNDTRMSKYCLSVQKLYNR